VAGVRGEGRATFGVPRSTPTERFWSKVDRRGEDECWPWTGASDGRGYGYLAGTRGQQATKAHRLSYELNRGPIPDGLCVCHRCDNPSCVNPSHLFLGTRRGNNADKVRKGRQPHNRGETNPNARLTGEDAARIKEMYGGGMTQQAIADQFGISQMSVSRIVRGQSWRVPVDV
jgi:hypothetical protein